MPNERAPILVAVALRDDDGAVLELAAELACATGAPLVLLHAYPFQQLIALPPPAWVEDLRAEVAAQLEPLAARLRPAAAVTTLCRPNPAPVRALHEAAEELGAGLLVAGSSHRGPAGRVLPGGVGERLLHAAPCTVAIAPRGYTRPQAGLRRIGVAFAAGPEAPEALELASSLARACHARVVTYTVTADAPPTLAAVLDRARAGVAPELLEDTVVLHGDTAAELASVSAGLDLLIAGSRGYGPIRSLLVGGVSSELAHTAQCPLLVVPRVLTE